MREARLPSKSLKALNSGLPERLPIRGRKIHRFVKIKSVVEAGMIGLWKRNNKLACPLVNCIYIDAGLLELVRWQQSDELKQKIRLCFEQFWHSLPHCFFKSIRIRPRDTIPGLCCTEMLVICRICVVIFIMPAKRRETHPDIYPWHCHARHV